MDQNIDQFSNFVHFQFTAEYSDEKS